MSISIFDVTGPVMIGPSSSHTAGAAKLARTARQLAGADIRAVSFGLHGSFAKTYAGHGTDRALLAGALGLSEQDERLPEAFALADEAGLAYDYYETELPDAHENSVLITFTHGDGTQTQVQGCSLGGGRIRIEQLDGFSMELYCERPSILVLHGDIPGILSKITSLTAEHGLNIAVLRSTRRNRGDVACCVLEADETPPPELKQALREISGVLRVEFIDADVNGGGMKG